MLNINTLGYGSIIRWVVLDYFILQLSFWHVSMMLSYIKNINIFAKKHISKSHIAQFKNFDHLSFKFVNHGFLKIRRQVALFSLVLLLEPFKLLKQVARVDNLEVVVYVVVLDRLACATLALHHPWQIYPEQIVHEAKWITLDVHLLLKFQIGALPCPRAHQAHMDQLENERHSLSCISLLVQGEKLVLVEQFE